jgi:hypothetical protein
MAINGLEILQDALDTGEEFEYQQQRFVINDISRLDWTVRKWGLIDQEATAKIDCAKRQIMRLEQYVKDIEEQADRQKASLEIMMEPFVRRQLSGKKVKTFKTPSGFVQIKAQHPEFTKDDDRLVQFLKDSGKPEFIKEEPKWGEFKQTLKPKECEDGLIRYVTPDGEVVQGVTGKSRPDKVIVKVNDVGNN